MFDEDVVELCAQCLADAAVHEGVVGDLELSARALARDLADTHRAHAGALLVAALRKATAYLDRSELDARSFATALRRLASLRADVSTRLA